MNYSIYLPSNARSAPVKKRRCRKELDRSIVCEFEGCERRYASKHAYRLHYRLKHQPGSNESKPSYSSDKKKSRGTGRTRPRSSVPQKPLPISPYPKQTSITLPTDPYLKYPAVTRRKRAYSSPNIPFSMTFLGNRQRATNLSNVLEESKSQSFMGDNLEYILSKSDNVSPTNDVCNISSTNISAASVSSLVSDSPMFQPRSGIRAQSLLNINSVGDDFKKMASEDILLNRVSSVDSIFANSTDVDGIFNPQHLGLAKLKSLDVNNYSSLPAEEDFTGIKMTLDMRPTNNGASFNLNNSNFKEADSVATTEKNDHIALMKLLGVNEEIQDFLDTKTNLFEQQKNWPFSSRNDSFGQTTQSLIGFDDSKEGLSLKFDINSVLNMKS